MSEEHARAALRLGGWLDALSVLLPPEGILLVGAGTGSGPWVQWLQGRAEDPVWLVEGDDTQYKHLLRNIPPDGNWTPRRDVVAASTEATIFHRASNPTESGLLETERLRELWSNIATVDKFPVEAPITLDALLSDAGGGINWLILDCLPAVPLLRGGSQLVRGLDVAVVRVTQGSASIPEAEREAVDEVLQLAGLRRIQVEMGRHPKVGHALYVRDVRRLNNDLAQTQAQIRDCQQRIEELSSAHAAALQKAAETLAQKDAWQRETAEKLGRLGDLRWLVDSPERGLLEIEAHVECALAAKITLNTSRPKWVQVSGQSIVFETEDQAPLYLVSNEDGDFNKPPRQPQFPVKPDTAYRLAGEVACEGGGRPQIWVFQYDATHKVDSHSIPADAEGHFSIGFRTLPSTQSIAIGIRVSGVGRLDARRTQMRLSEHRSSDVPAQQSNTPAKIDHVQKRDIDNAVRQVEACIRLQHYLGPEVMLPEVHNWPISPDFGVLLIQLVEDHEYDAVIEFGSGTSTLILAKALHRVAQRKGQPHPSPLLSFDHLEQYRHRAEWNLVKAGLTQHCRVELAPLAPWHSRLGTEFSYYACDQALQQLRPKLKDEGAKVLVVVDGPPAGTCQHARFPALPKVLDVLGIEQVMHFLMDDYIRKDEQEIVTAWEAELSARQLSYTRTELNGLEKKACLLEVYQRNEQEARKAQ